ncbi:MAG: radical SAM protein, partial [Lachnospiraceae bacterium]|nr:radical SAM protein [Lachnospiraceae bacterium]
MNRYIQYMYSYPHKTAYRFLENVNLRDYFFNLEGEGHGLYLHLPFCESKCGYCNLFSVTGCGRNRIDGYLDAVLRQIKQYSEMLPQSTSFEEFTIGGGTPLLLESEQIARIFKAVGGNLPMGSGCKVIIETAPNQTDQERAGLLKRLGVTRVSMGIQSFDDGELRWLGRTHDSGR